MHIAEKLHPSAMHDALMMVDLYILGMTIVAH